MTQTKAKAMNDMVKVNELVTKNDLEIALANIKHEILKWMFGMIIAQITLIITAFGIGIAILK